MRTKTEFMERAFAAGYDWKAIKDYQCRYNAPELTRKEWLSFCKEKAKQSNHL